MTHNPEWYKTYYPKVRRRKLEQGKVWRTKINDKQEKGFSKYIMNWVKKHPECIEKINKRAKKWQVDNRERYNEYQREYQREYRKKNLKRSYQFN